MRGENAALIRHGTAEILEDGIGVVRIPACESVLVRVAEFVELLDQVRLLLLKSALNLVSAFSAAESGELPVCDGVAEHAVQLAVVPLRVDEHQAEVLVRGLDGDARVVHEAP